jgi:hypothetical protein
MLALESRWKFYIPLFAKHGFVSVAPTIRPDGLLDLCISGRVTRSRGDSALRNMAAGG